MRKLRNNLFEQLKPLPPESVRRPDSPVIFPPGLARLATKPSATGSPILIMTIGIESGSVLGCSGWRPTACHDYRNFVVNKLSRKSGELIKLAFRESVFDENVIALNVAQVT